MERSGICRFMHGVLKKYESIRGKEIADLTGPFWDVVVITAADKEQGDIFIAQIEDKIQRNELPKGLPIHVVADPPGPKLGNGGSTLTAVSFLHKKYGKDLYKYKVLMLHAGGLSKRMPSTSILGKVFSPIPTGNPIYQMLDMKLAMYLPFIPRMPPGIFVACADDFLVFNLGEEDLKWTISETGFTAFAHPSTVAVGIKHGVYIVNSVESVDTQKPLQSCRCLEVLQKPSEEAMYRKGAVLNGKDLKFPDGIQVQGKTAYTDSCFFFGMDVAKKFIKFVEENGTVACEIDAYGDFLQALGPNATVDYIYNTSNVTTVTPNLLPTREKIFNLLKGTEISLLLMNSSKFVHIGSTKEYINHFCFDTTFQSELCLTKDIFNCWTEEANESDSDDVPKKRIRLSDTSSGCTMHCVLPQSSFVSENSIVEYCHFDMPVNIGQNTIVSNCSSLSKESTLQDNQGKLLKIPSNVFLHTVPVKVEEKIKYVTLHFEIDENLKKQSQIKDLPFLGKTVEDFASLFSIDLSLLVPFEKVIGQGEGQEGCKISLWDTSLFPIAETMTDSLDKSLEIIKSVRQNKKFIDLTNSTLVSMATILDIKDFKAMLNNRKNLFLLIQRSEK